MSVDEYLFRLTRIHKTIILPVVLYGCATWSLTLKEEHRRRVLIRIFGPKRDEVTGGWRRLHNEELHNLYSSPSIVRIANQIKKDEMGGACSTNGEEEKCILVGKAEGKRPLGRPRWRWVDNIKMDLR
jgi:hypothetical protein